MFEPKRRSTLLLILSLFFLSAILLVSTHIHVSSENDSDKTTCPLCQLAAGTKLLFVDKVSIPEPLTIVAVLAVADFLSIRRGAIQSPLIRGPPVV
jgi:hypothetical protein